MSGLVDGAVVGAVFRELLKAVLEATNQAINFKSDLDRLKTTVLSIKPVFDDIEKLNRVLERPQEETNMFMDLLRDAEALVWKCSKVKCWNVYKKITYSRKLNSLDSSIVRFFQVDVQILMSRDSRKMFVGMDSMSDELDHMISVPTNGGCSLNSSNSFAGSFCVPGVPDFVVGLDVPLRELKLMLLKDGVSEVLLSAPGGCGKTTLAKMLCRDQEIQDIHRDDIFFVNVSKTPKLKVIIQKIFQHKGFYQATGFQSDEHAFYQLEHVLTRGRTKSCIVGLG